MRQVHLIDPRTQAMLAPIYPLDRKKNAEGLRRKIGAISSDSPQKQEKKESVMPPLLQKIMAEYAASGLPPAYIVDPKSHGSEEEAAPETQEKNPNTENTEGQNS